MFGIIIEQYYNVKIIQKLKFTCDQDKVKSYYSWYSLKSVLSTILEILGMINSDILSLSFYYYFICEIFILLHGFPFVWILHLVGKWSVYCGVSYSSYSRFLVRQMMPNNIKTKLEKENLLWCLQWTYSITWTNSKVTFEWNQRTVFLSQG